MLSAPLLISYRESEAPLLAADAALEEGCQGICFDLCLRPFGSSRSNAQRRTCYPSLRDLFEHCGDRLFLDVSLETKGMESEILEVVRQCGPRRNYVFSSALPEVV